MSSWAYNSVFHSITTKLSGPACEGHACNQIAPAGFAAAQGKAVWSLSLSHKSSRIGQALQASVGIQALVHSGANGVADVVVGK